METSTLSRRSTPNTPFDPSEELFKAHSHTPPPSRLFRYAKALFLLGGSAAGFALGVLGFCLLFSLFTLRMLAPAVDNYSAELYFDFTRPVAVATTHLQSGLTLDPATQGKAAELSARVLPAGRRFDAWLELQVPDDAAHNSGDVFQVTGRLLTGNDEVAASITRPWLLPYRSPFSQRVRSIWRLPLSLVGYHRRHKLQMQLFKAQRESLTEPFVRFQAGLQARANGGSLPRVQKAKVTVQLHLGWLLRLLYLVRPGRWMTLLLATVGVSAVGVGATACLSLLFMWLFVGPVAPDSHAAKLSSPLLDETLSEEPDSGAELDYNDLRSESSSQVEEQALERLQGEQGIAASTEGLRGQGPDEDDWQQDGKAGHEELAEGTAIGVPVHELTEQQGQMGGQMLHKRSGSQKKEY